MTDLKLFHRDVLIGTVSNIAPEDMFEMNGDITLTPEAESYKHVFAFLSNEDAMTSGAELPFGSDYLEGWFLEDEDGVRKEIPIPAIDEDGEIIWREGSET